MKCNICQSELREDGSCPVCGNIQPIDPSDMPTTLIDSKDVKISEAMMANMQPQSRQKMSDAGQQQYNQQMPNMPQQQYNQQMQDMSQQQYNQQMPNMPQQQYYQQMPNVPQQQYNQQMPNMPQQQYNQQIQNTRNGKTKKTGLIIGIIIAAVVLIIAIILILVFGGKEKDLTNKDKTTEATTERPKKTTETTTEATTEEIIVGEAGTKTIMLYMVGSNLESEYQAATDDIGEICTSGFDEAKINFLIYTGGCREWFTDGIPDDKNAAFIVENGELRELYSEEQRNMGDPDTLSDFINYGQRNYPAEFYSVILWNHGGGAFSGYGYDELTEDLLSLKELDEAFGDTVFNESHKLDWIGFDACLMANVETAKVLSPYADYMIASQESEPGFGWSYAFLDDIEDMDDAEQIGSTIVDEYISYCEEAFRYNPFAYCDVTLSVMKLDKLDAVEAALDTMYGEINANFDDATYARMSRTRARAKSIANMFQGEQSYDVVDLKDLAIQSVDDVGANALALQEAVEDFVVYSNSNVSRVGGVSVYYPYNAKQASAYYLAMYPSFNFAPEYLGYIQSFAGRLTNAQYVQAEWDAATMLPYMLDSTRFAMQLSPEQVMAYDDAYFVISRTDMNEPNKLMFVSMSSDTELDAQGIVQANFDGNIIYIENQTTHERYEAMYTLQEKTSEYTRYLISCILFNDNIQEETAMYAYLVLEVTPGNPAGSIIAAYPIANLVYSSDGGYMFPDMYEIDMNDYAYIAFGSMSHEFSSTEDINNFDESQWSDLMLHYNEMPISDGFATVTDVMLPDIPYFGMFVIQDIQGGYHYSNVVQIK